MPPPSMRSNFFSSLRRAEKRLKSEHPSQPSNPSPLDSNPDFSDSLSSPIFIHCNQSNQTSNSTFYDSSEPPQAFLSPPPPFTATHEKPSTNNPPDHSTEDNGEEIDAVDDIHRLIQLLGLSDSVEERCEEGAERERGSLGWECGDGFYEKIVGVKGPKCKKEVERMEGWIKHYLNDGNGEERREPLRLAHLILGKAAYVLEGGDGGFGGLEFPSTVEEFLKNDPPGQ